MMQPDVESVVGILAGERTCPLCHRLESVTDKDPGQEGHNWVYTCWRCWKNKNWTERERVKLKQRYGREI